MMLMVIVQPAQAQQAAVATNLKSSVGETGRRLERGQVVDGIEPGGRINSRVANRVQLRLRNRIDRFYDPSANAASPFAVAGEQVSAANRGGRRR